MQATPDFIAKVKAAQLPQTAAACGQLEEVFQQIQNEIKDFAGGYPIIAASRPNASSVAAAATLVAAQQAAMLASVSTASVAAAGAS